MGGGATMAKEGGKTADFESLVIRFLQQISNSLAYLVINTKDLKGKSKNELIPILAGLGFDNMAIASILQTTPQNVQVRLSQIRSKNKGRKGSRAKSESTNETSENVK
jgi:hypothetical protein